jgi:protein-S-isoprenylcysteine O-methyltransferase Ste14
MNPLVPPPVVAAIIGVVMWAVDRKLELGKFESALLAPVAGVLLIVGLLLMFVAVASFVAAKTTVNPLRPSRASSLVTTGIFRISRNPIYLGDLLVLAALAVWLGNLVNVVLLFPFVWYINRFQIIPEERVLEKLFGASYVAYCSRVRRWL